MNKKNPKINKELVVNSTTENLTSIRNFIKQAAADAGVTDENTGKIMLAVDEACTNIIKHAYKYSSKGKIILKVNFDKNKMSVKIIDEGGHFNPELIPAPDIQLLQHQRKGGGLGMFLMKKLMDEVKYTNLANNKNQVLLIKYRN